MEVFWRAQDNMLRLWTLQSIVILLGGKHGLFWLKTLKFPFIFLFNQILPFQDALVLKCWFDTFVGRLLDGHFVVSALSYRVCVGDYTRIYLITGALRGSVRELAQWYCSVREQITERFRLCRHWSLKRNAFMSHTHRRSAPVKLNPVLNAWSCAWHCRTHAHAHTCGARMY